MAREWSFCITRCHMRKVAITMIMIAPLLSFLPIGWALAGLPEDATRAIQHGDNQKAYRLVKALAEQGDGEAQHALGVLYLNGQGVAQDYAEAAKWFRKAAEQGYTGSMNNLGVMYKNGQGMPRDYAEAAKLFKRGAGQGHPEAAFNLGVLYYNGTGVPQDYTEA